MGGVGIGPPPMPRVLGARPIPPPTPPRSPPPPTQCGPQSGCMWKESRITVSRQGEQMRIGLHQVRQGDQYSGGVVSEKWEVTTRRQLVYSKTMINGDRVIITGDHPVWEAGRWVEAQSSDGWIKSGGWPHKQTKYGLVIRHGIRREYGHWGMGIDWPPDRRYGKWATPHRLHLRREGWRQCYCQPPPPPRYKEPRTPYYWFIMLGFWFSMIDVGRQWKGMARGITSVPPLPPWPRVHHQGVNVTRKGHRERAHVLNDHSISTKRRRGS